MALLTGYADLEMAELRGYTSFGFEQITSLSTVQTLTVPADATKAIVNVTTQNVRWRADGTDPTATVGIQVAANTSQVFVGQDLLTALEFIEETASAVINVAYFG